MPLCRPLPTRRCRCTTSFGNRCTAVASHLSPTCNGALPSGQDGGATALGKPRGCMVLACLAAAEYNRTMPRIPDNCRLLHGPYRPPAGGLGKRLRCCIRGRMVVKRMSAGPIPWPQTIVCHVRAFILCGDLVRAVRRESEVAVAYWWGVNWQTVWAWRKALGVAATTEGTSRLRSECFSQP
jgi:hypothetical protein